MGRLPEAASTVIVGAGVHGLSTALHLTTLAHQRGLPQDVVVLDKLDVAAGASGIACGVVRNNYSQSPMRALMAHSVRMWESDPKAFAYNPVGYLQVAPAVMADEIARIHDEQRAIGYASELIEGAAACQRYLRGLFDDWSATGAEIVLHEKQGGHANNVRSMHGLAAKARAAGAAIVTGVQVKGITRDASGAVVAVETDHGTIACDQLVVAVGPWIRDLWAMLALPETIEIAHPGGAATTVPMWTYWALQEGTLNVDPQLLHANGRPPPVVHVDSDTPLVDDEDGSLVTDELWGVYYKPDHVLKGIQGGAMPMPVDRPADQVAVDPYGPASPDFVVDDGFVRMWTSALAHCHRRLKGRRHRYRREPSGGIGAFTPDSFPVFDVFGHNAYVVADSNHGYKMIGVGELVARELLGAPQELLEPFRFARFASGATFPVSSSPFPWS